MMMQKLILPVCAILLFTGCATLNKNGKATIDVNAMLEQYAKESYALNPLSATANNVNDYNDQLGINISKAYAQKYLDFNRRSPGKLSSGL